MQFKSAWRVLVGVMHFQVPTIAALHIGAVTKWPLSKITYWHIHFFLLYVK
jgi:hypothetical protein